MKRLTEIFREVERIDEQISKLQEEITWLQARRAEMMERALPEDDRRRKKTGD